MDLLRCLFEIQGENQVWWCTLVILVLRMLRQEDPKFQDSLDKFEASLSFIVRPCLKKKKKKGRE
jgi:hypothetical protein